jgi:D-sedoheptulose 7-phosphate isomerase
VGFPEAKFIDAGDYADAYFGEVAGAAASVDLERVREAAEILLQVHLSGGMVFSCGNGGSAAIANHLVCDHCKLVQTDTPLKPRICSLSANIEVMTAVSNDISYDEVFVYQLRSMATVRDLLITISSSGDSENIVRAARWAVDNGLKVIAMTGFEGGRSADLAHVNLHVPARNYGVVEDVHQSLMHILAQYLRQAHMDEALIRVRPF